MKQFIKTEVRFSRWPVDFNHNIIYFVGFEDTTSPLEYTRHYWRRFELCMLLNIDTQKLTRQMKKFGAELIGKGCQKYFGFDPKNKEGQKKAAEYLESLYTAMLLQN